MRHKLLFLISLLVVASCQKDGGYVLDKGVYINLTTGGETFTTYGFSNARDKQNDGPELSVTFTPDASNTPQTQILLVATNEIIDVRNQILFTMGNCYADIYLSKPGNDVIGQYSQPIGNLTSNSFIVNAKKYYPSKSGLSFNITKTDSYRGRSTYEGNFTAILRPQTDTTLSQPATGTFKVYVR